MLTTLLLTTVSAWAVDHEVSGELGTLRNTDRAYDVYTSLNAMPSRGLGGTLALHERVGVTGGWHRSSRGSELYFGDDSPAVVAAFYTDTFDLGVKADVALGDMLRPYVQASGLLVRGVSRVDDDPSDPVSVGQIKEAGLTGGALGLAGLTLRISGDRINLPLGFSVHAGLGYGYVGRVDLGDLGTIKPGGGFASRAGLSLIF